jgi:hypothetical protein
VRLVQEPQVRIRQGPPRAELGQQLAASGEQVCEPAFLAAEPNTEGWCYTTISSRSRPMPVSTLLRGSRARLRSSCRR